MNLNKLPAPEPCGIEILRDSELILCRKPAHWSVDDTPVCEDDMRAMAGMNSDNEAFFAPALAQQSKEASE